MILLIIAVLSLSLSLSLPLSLSLSFSFSLPPLSLYQIFYLPILLSIYHLSVCLSIYLLSILLTFIHPIYLCASLNIYIYLPLHSLFLSNSPSPNFPNFSFAICLEFSASSKYVLSIFDFISLMLLSQTVLLLGKLSCVYKKRLLIFLLLR